MEWILGLLVLVLAAAVIFVVYLTERINVFETMLGLNPKVTTDKLAEHVNFGPNPFGDLSGENLWKAMSGETIEDPDIEIGDLERLRPRYEHVLTRHIEMLIEDGRFDARASERTAAKSTIRVTTLRGSVESYIPYVEASRLYEIGQEIENAPDTHEALSAEIDEIVDDLFKHVDLTRTHSFGKQLMPVPDAVDDDDELPDYTDEFPDIEGSDQPALPSSETEQLPDKSTD